MVWRGICLAIAHRTKRQAAVLCILKQPPIDTVRSAIVAEQGK
jgi:hypothetical protein